MPADYDRSWSDMMAHVLELAKTGKALKIVTHLAPDDIPEKISIRLPGDLQVGIIRQWDRLTKLGQVNQEDLYEVLKLMMVEMDRAHRRKGYGKHSKAFRKRLAEPYEDVDLRPRIPGIHDSSS